MSFPVRALTDYQQALVTVKVDPHFSLTIDPKEISIYQVDKLGRKVFGPETIARWDAVLFKKFQTNIVAGKPVKTKLLKLTLTEK